MNASAAFFAVSGDRFFSLISGEERKWTLKEQQQLCQSTWTHPITNVFPRNVALRTQVLKRFVALLESRAIAVDDLLYEQLGLLMTTKNDNRDFHTYFIGEKSISIESHRNIVENGTTGLYSWPAGKQFAHFAIQKKELFENKTIVELGSGSGLTGIIIASFCNPRSYVFTDHSDSVLRLISKNVSANGLNTKCKICSLDWTIDGDSLPDEIEVSSPDLIVACDVVFDERIVAGFCRQLRLLTDKFRCKSFVLSTIRNRASIERLEEQLRMQKLEFNKCEMRGVDSAPFFVQIKECFVLHEIIGNKV